MDAWKLETIEGLYSLILITDHLQSYLHPLSRNVPPLELRKHQLGECIAVRSEWQLTGTWNWVMLHFKSQNGYSLFIRTWLWTTLIRVKRILEYPTTVLKTWSHNYQKESWLVNIRLGQIGNCPNCGSKDNKEACPNCASKDNFRSIF